MPRWKRKDWSVRLTKTRSRSPSNKKIIMHEGWVWFRLCTNVGTIDGCGFVRYKRQFSTDFCSREHTVCPLSGIKKRPLVGGFLYTSTIVISIGATAGVLYREDVRWWEGPLWEVPLYILDTYIYPWQDSIILCTVYLTF